jgi:hypothetical protein
LAGALAARRAMLKQESPVMASAPQSNSLPILYSDLIPLNSQEHGSFRILASDAAPFLAKHHAVPLTVDELISAQRFMPVVFSAGDDAIPLALMGLNEGVNTIVDDDGKLRGAIPGCSPSCARRPTNCRSASIPLLARSAISRMASRCSKTASRPS